MLTELKNRGVADVCIAVCDGLKGLPGRDHHRVAATRGADVHHPPAAQHVPLRLPKYWDQIAHDLRPVYTAATEAEALARFEEFAEKWGARTRRSAGCGGTPGRSSCRSWTTTWRSAGSSAPPTPIESLNARYRRAVRARGHFPNEQAALKCLYLVTRSLDPTGRGRARWAMRWKPALNAFAITFEGRITPAGN